MTTNKFVPWNGKVIRNDVLSHTARAIYAAGMFVGLSLVGYGILKKWGVM